MARGDEKPTPDEFDRIARELPEPGLVGEFAAFLRRSGKWWLLPVLIVLGLFGLLVVLAGSGAAPFIYTLF
jgi:hypothetical protein